MDFSKKIIRLDAFRRWRNKRDVGEIRSVALAVESGGIVGLLRVDFTKGDPTLFCDRFNYLIQTRGDDRPEESDDNLLLEFVYADYHAIPIDRRFDGDAGRDEIMAQLYEKGVNWIDISTGWKPLYMIENCEDLDVHITGDGLYWTSHSMKFRSMTLPWEKIYELRKEIDNDKGR